MIYIDPPYNTGNDYIYDDDFAEDTKEFLRRSNQKDEAGNRLMANTESNGRFHSDWLSMMYPRLKLSRNLLRDDGVIFISIDDGEVHNLRKACDEVFGESNFIANIVWQKKYSPQNDAKYFSDSHEHILLYAKNKLSYAVGLLPRTEEANARYKNLDNDPRGPWKSSDLTRQEYRPNDDYEIVNPANGRIFRPPKGTSWGRPKANVEQMIKDNRIWFGPNGDSVPSIKRFLSEVKQGITPQTIWMRSEVGDTQEGKKLVKDIFKNATIFETPKPPRLIERQLLTAKFGDDDIVLDFFAGSSTTAHAVMQLNAKDNGKRKFIMIQLPEHCDENSEAFKAGYKTIADIGKERIRRAGRKIKEENSLITKDLDIGFRVFKVDTSNMKDVYYIPDKLDQGNLDLFKEHIKPDRRPEDLLYQVFLDWGIDLSLPIEKGTIDGKTVFIVDTDAMIACFDKGITEEFVKKLAGYKPLRAVFRDDAFESDSVKINVEQIFKLLTPSTELKSI
ncbi:MAG: site-specific DNA-methyltransferase [Syntrophales bacterium]|jgi:adenine-specific DNA-methyltransferase|nr:site-specific DNA-methyltransferase [Syntrophales bacterium]